MKKLLVSLLLVCFAFSVVLSGCGANAGQTGTTNGTTGGTTAAVSAENTTEPKSLEETHEPITLKHTGWGSPNEKKVTQNAINGFMKKYPWIKVEYTHIPTDYNTKISTMIAANQGPDTGLLGGDVSLDWASQGKLVNIMDYLNNDPDITPADILPQTFYWWDTGKCAGFNGALEAFGLFYNKDMFQEAGVETPPTKAEEAWTWDKFVEVCQKLTLDNKGRNALDPNFDPKTSSSSVCSCSCGRTSMRFTPMAETS